MKRTFTLKLLSSIFLSSVLLCQSAGASQEAAIQAQRKAQKARTEGELREAYQDIQRLRPALKQPVLSIIHDKAVDLPMVSPGVNPPANIPVPEFEAIAKTKEFKRLTVEKQNEILHDLDNTVHGRGAGPITLGEIQGALGAAGVPAPQIGEILAPVVHAVAIVGMDPALQAAILAIPAVQALDVLEQNQVLAAVRDAMAAEPHHGAPRDAAIRAELAHTGIGAINLAFENAVIHEVDAAHPHVPVLLTAVALGMDAGLHGNILGIPAVGGLTIPEKNQVLTEVQAAVGGHPAGPARDADIRHRLGGLGIGAIDAAAQNLIVAAVTHVHPHVPILLTAAGLGMDAAVYGSITGDAAFTALAPNVALQNQVLQEVQAAINVNPSPAHTRRVRRTAVRANLLGIRNPAINNRFIGAIIIHVQ